MLESAPVEAKRRSRYRGPVKFEDHLTGANLCLPNGIRFCFYSIGVSLWIKISTVKNEAGTGKWYQPLLFLIQHSLHK